MPPEMQHIGASRKANVLSSNSIFLVSSRAGNDIYGVFRGEIQSSFSEASCSQRGAPSQIGFRAKKAGKCSSRRRDLLKAGGLTE